MTGHARRTRSGPRTARSWGPALAACAAALLVLVAVVRELFSDATAEAAEAPADSASVSDGAAPLAVLPAPSPDGPDGWRQAPGMQAVELVAGQVREVVLVLQ